MAIGDPYLTETEYESFGLPALTDPNKVMQATRLVDAYTLRVSDQGPQTGFWVGEYREQQRLKPDRHTLRLSYRPVIELVQVRARVRRNRHSDPFPDVNDLDMFTLTGSSGIPKWQALDITGNTVQLDEDGRVWVAPTLFGIKWSEAEVIYKAGYTIIPDAIKQAVALIAREVPDELFIRPQNAQAIQEGNTRMTLFEPGMIPTEAKRLLEPFKTRSFA